MTEPWLPKPTARVIFRAWRGGDLPLAEGLWGDPQVTALISARPWTAEQVRARLQLELDHARDHGVQYWPVFVDGAHAGCCGLHIYPPESGVYELGFHLRPAFWGKGLVSEAARSVVALAFEEMRVPELFAGHHPQNLASRRVLERLGFAQRGEAFFAPTGLMHPNLRLRAPLRPG